MYEVETGKYSPSLDVLAHSLRQAKDKLGDCARIYPDDRIPHFYYAIALTLKNQEIYASRVHQMRDALLARGEMLIMREQLRLHAPALDLDLKEWSSVSDPRQSWLLEHFMRAREKSKPFFDLGRQHWFLLADAIREFQLVRSKGPEELKNTAAYNLAQVCARLGDQKSLQNGIDALKRNCPCHSSRRSAGTLAVEDSI